MDCEVCQDAAGYCESCGGSSSREALMGVSGSRGRYWAADVWDKAPERRGQPWPPFEAKARSIALRWVDDLGGSAETRERRAHFCWDRARDEWEQLQLR